MDIAANVLLLKKDFDDVKAAGYAKGYEEGSANGGSQSVDLFPYMTGAPIFTNADFSDVTEDITLHLEGVNSLASSFSGVKFGCKKLTVYISNKCLSLFRAFRMGNSLEELELVGATSQINNYNSAFQERTTLKRILGNFDFSSATNVGNMFYRADALEEFYPVANTIKISISFADSPNLIPACKQAIIEGLADLTGQATQTITFHKDVVLTEEQKATITLKNWTLVQ